MVPIVAPPTLRGVTARSRVLPLRRVLLTCVLLPLSGATACEVQGKGPPPPSPVVVAFYSLRIASRTTGAPTTAELTRLKPFVSDTLSALLAAAGALRDREARRAPNEKPPFAEGDLYSSLFEGPTSFVVLRDSVSTRAGKSVVQFTHVSNGERFTWTDTVKLGRKGRFDVIDDVLYGGAGDFNNHGTLRGTLESALRAP